MAKIAVDLERALARRGEQGGRGIATGRRLAEGAGWSVEDVICTSGPEDRPFEEQHTGVSIAIVVAGSFEYRSTAGHGFLCPGSLLLGNAGHCFECGHQHGRGDRCVAFRFSPEYFERLAADAGGSRATSFRVPRLPPLKELSPLVASACAGLLGAKDLPAENQAGRGLAWEELGLRLAARALELADGLPRNAAGPPPGALARVTQAVRTIERVPEAGLTLTSLAENAGLSPYHFLRTFERVTGVTPHQYLLRSRLRQAALRLAAEAAPVTAIAFDAGFGDLSNFHRSFRAEFGSSPRAFRRLAGQSVPRPAA